MTTNLATQSGLCMIIQLQLPVPIATVAGILSFLYMTYTHDTDTAMCTRILRNYHLLCVCVGGWRCVASVIIMHLCVSVNGCSIMWWALLPH